MTFIVSPTYPFSIVEEGGVVSSVTATDFLSYYNASKVVLSGNSQGLYDPSFMKSSMCGIVNTPISNDLPFLYPPQTLLFFSALSLLDIDQSFLVWSIVNIMATILFMAICLNRVKPHNKNSIVFLSILTSTYYPWINNMYQGQVMIFVTLGLWGYYLLVNNKRYFLAGILVVACAFKPQLFIVPVLYLMIINGSRLWLSTILAGITTFVLCSLVFGWEIWWSYLEILVYGEKEMRRTLNGMVNIRSLLFLFFGSSDIELINLTSLALWGLSVLVILLLGVLLKGKSKEVKEMGFMLSIVIGCLFSPWLYIHACILLIIPMVYLASSGKFKILDHSLLLPTIFNMSAIIVVNISLQLSLFFWILTQLFLIGLIIRNIVLDYSCKVIISK